MVPRPGLTPEKVVDAAVAVVDAEGAPSLTLGAVADRLGVRTPSLYNHVDGLDDLRRRLTVRALAELRRRLERAAVGRSADDAVRSLAVAYRRFAVEHPGLYAATVPTSEVDDEAIRAAGAEALTVVIASLQAFGLEGDDTVHAARTIRSAVHGFVSLELAGGFGLDVDVEASFDWLVDLVNEGLRIRSATGTRS